MWLLLHSFGTPVLLVRLTEREVIGNRWTSIFSLRSFPHRFLDRLPSRMLLNPKLNQEIAKKKFLWSDVPKRELGPHDGLPDTLRNF